MTIHPILKCSLLFMVNSPTAPGGICVPLCWFKKKYARRGRLNYAITVTALTNFIYN